MKNVMNTGILLLVAGLLSACASTQTAKQFRYISYEETPTPQKSVGTLEGKDCAWSVLGYSLGQPNVRTAFANAAAQKGDALIPFREGEAKGPPLKSVRNVTVEDGGFNAWVASRSCVVVTAEGYL